MTGMAVNALKRSQHLGVIRLTLFDCVKYPGRLHNVRVPCLYQARNLDKVLVSDTYNIWFCYRALEDVPAIAFDDLLQLSLAFLGLDHLSQYAKI